MARSAVSAPRNDIAIFKALKEDDNAIIRMIGTKTLARHLWYLFEVTVGMALLDEELSFQEKETFVVNMKEVDGSEVIPPRLRAPDGINDMTVASFSTKNIKKFFELLDIDTRFFDEDPANLKESAS